MDAPPSKPVPPIPEFQGKWWQLRLRHIFIAIAFFGAFLAASKWAASRPDPTGLICLVCLPLLVATMGSVFGKPSWGVAVALLCLIGLVSACLAKLLVSAEMPQL